MSLDEELEVISHLSDTEAKALYQKLDREFQEHPSPDLYKRVAHVLVTIQKLTGHRIA